MFDVKTPPSAASTVAEPQVRGVAPLHEEPARLERTQSVPYTPIRSLGASHREQILEHLLSLPAHDRYLRFGYPASDEQVKRYVYGLDFKRDEIFGIHNSELELIAVAHLAFDAASEGKPRAAEFGVSVCGGYRGRRLGARLYDRAVMHARNAGVQTMYIHALSENVPMLRIARNAGATVHRDGCESEAYLTLPPANLNSRLSEVWEDQIGEFDYRLKAQTYQFQAFLSSLQKQWGTTSSAPETSTNTEEVR
ncbi:GNAT family N-acetyltransferase [Lampropedia puyangensis]|uniref:GNAT family N-acetyltransferase n=1 Tax=Lampropedia puyangensis TaxID=1330072 RepID=A0A4S8FB03_9BURK|nr:GNAT family N-acetyltransferase [Lampropedia puyangensis]THU04467.1 GNAT family N-acetyltransferase [Lampropedia puyangensis]